MLIKRHKPFDFSQWHRHLLFFGFAQASPEHPMLNDAPAGWVFMETVERRIKPGTQDDHVEYRRIGEPSLAKAMIAKRLRNQEAMKAKTIPQIIEEAGLTFVVPPNLCKICGLGPCGHAWCDGPHRQADATPPEDGCLPTVCQSLGCRAPARRMWNARWLCKEHYDRESTGTTVLPPKPAAPVGRSCGQCGGGPCPICDD